MMAIGSLMATLLAIQTASGAHFPFEPLRIETTIRFGSGQFDCRTTFQGREISRTCSVIDGTGAPGALRALGVDGTMTMTVSLDPEGAAPLPGDDRDRGEVLIESESVYRVTEDGDVADCRPTRQRVIRRIEGIRDVPNLCDSELIGNGAFVRAPGNGARRGRASMRLYLSTGGTS